MEIREVRRVEPVHKTTTARKKQDQGDFDEELRRAEEKLPNPLPAVERRKPDEKSKEKSGRKKTPSDGIDTYA